MTLVKQTRETMKIQLQLSIWAFIYLLLLLKKGRSNNFDWTSVLPYVREICEFEENCDTSESNQDESNIYAKNACCKGCGCENCNDSMNRQKLYSGLTQCIKPVEDEQGDQEYLFVVDEPKDGCITDTPVTGVIPSCKQAIMAAPWGNFYPVYSSDKKMNFKNKQCALCHGATKVTEWNVYVFFLGVDSNKLHIFRNYYNDFNSTDMLLRFYPPNRESRVYENACHTLKDKCHVRIRDSFYIPTSVNVTRAKVVQACEEGKESPFAFNKDVYKNIFCAICDNRASTMSDSLVCEENQVGPEDDVKSSGKTFASLIDHEFIESKFDENRQIDNVPLACLPTASSDTPVKEDCRQLLCPALQVRQKDGSCRYPMEKIFISRLDISLKLTTSRRIEPEIFQNITETEIETVFKISMPWPRNWELISLYRRIDTLHGNWTELFMAIGYKNFNSIDMNYLKDVVTTALSKEWIVDLDKRYTFRQNLHIHGLLAKTTTGRGVHGHMKPLWALRNEIHSMFLNLSGPTWDVLFSNALTFFYQPPGYSLKLTKLYFCDQIGLHAHEFVGTTGAFPLFIKRTEKIIYPSQYKMYVGDNSSYIVNLCIGDSDFGLQKRSNFGPKHAISVNIWLIYLAYHLLTRSLKNY